MDTICRRNDCRWSELIKDFLLLIVDNEQLSLGDIVRMALVCKSWRSTIIENVWYDLYINLNIGKTSFPWLMLAENSSNDDDNIDKRRFFNPATGGVTELYLPEASGRRCCGAAYGWIVTMGQELDINILNPLTREQLTLPSELTIDTFSDGSTNDMLLGFISKTDIFHFFMRKTVLTCSPNQSDKMECMAVSLFDSVIAGYQVGCAKLGDSRWTILPYARDDEDETVDVNDIIFYQGYLYGISVLGELIVMDLYDHEKKWTILSPPLVRICADRFPYGYFHFYLAEIEGTFVAVARYKRNKTLTLTRRVGDDNDYETVGVLVFKFLKGNWCQTNDIGNCSLFLGLNQTIVLSPVGRGFRANCIYFTDDYDAFFAKNVHPIRGYDMVVYCLHSNEIASYFEGLSLSRFSPPFWVTLNSTL